METKVDIPNMEKVDTASVRQATRAACFNGAVMRSNFMTQQTWEKQFELLESLIEEFPEDDNAEDTNYLAQYALVLKAIADGVENAKDPSPLLQNFVDEEFGQFDDLYDKASELTSTILEYLEDREELVD